MSGPIETGIGYVTPADEFSVERQDGSVNPQAVRSLQETVNTLIANYNGRVSMGDGTDNSRAGNLDAAYSQETLTPGANVEFPLKHNLERVPIGFDVIQRDKAAIVYDSRKGSWTASTMFLKCSVAATTIRLRVY